MISCFERLKSSTVLKEIDIYSIPTNYIINQKGKVVYEKVGAESNWRSQETMDKILSLVQ